MSDDVTPTEQQINDMQKRIGIKQTGDLEEIIEDLKNIVRLQPKRSQRLLGMTLELYELFGVEPPDDLDDDGRTTIEFTMNLG